MKAKIVEKTKSPAIIGPRIMVYSAAAILAPFSGGITLLALPFLELGFRAQKRNATEELERLRPTARKEATTVFSDLIKNGEKSATIKYSARTDGWGKVTKQIHFSVLEDEED